MYFAYCKQVEKGRPKMKKLTTEDLMARWSELAENAGYGGYAGSGTVQQADAVVAMQDFTDDQDVRFGMVVGFLATSLGERNDVWETAEDLTS